MGERGRPTSLRSLPVESGVSRDRPCAPSRALLRHGALANLLGSALLPHKEMHMAANTRGYPNAPASCIWFLHTPQKMGAIPGGPVGFYTPA